MTPPKPWYTVGEVAVVLHVQRMTAWRLLRPYRAACHLARAGRHPRLCLWVPGEVVAALLATRAQWWPTRAPAPIGLPAPNPGNPVKPFLP